MCRFWERIEFSLLNGWAWHSARCWQSYLAESRAVLRMLCLYKAYIACVNVEWDRIACVCVCVLQLCVDPSTYAFAVCIRWQIHNILCDRPLCRRKRQAEKNGNTTSYARNKCVGSGCETDTLKRRMEKMRRGKKTTKSLSFSLSITQLTFFVFMLNAIQVYWEIEVLNGTDGCPTGILFVRVDRKCGQEKIVPVSSFYWSFVERLIFMIKSVPKHVPAVNHS